MGSRKTPYATTKSRLSSDGRCRTYPSDFNPRNNWSGTKLVSKKMKQIVLAIETTGPYVIDGHRVIEIACLALNVPRRKSSSFHCRLNPERDVDPGAAEVHGFTFKDLKHEPIFTAIAADFLKFISGAELLIQNAPFHVAFLNAELLRLGFPRLESICTITDTYELAREMYPGEPNSLSFLCRRFGIPELASGSGLVRDVRLLAEVYLAMTGRRRTPSAA